MIVRPVDGGILCVLQREHAALSGALAEAWRGALAGPAPRDSVVRAARDHDAGWAEPDRAPRFDPAAAGPFDYRTAPLADRLAVAERSVGRVAAADPYAGWLVSRHFASFHAGSDDPDAAGWVVEQVGRRAGMLARARPRAGEAALHPHVLEAAFDRLQLFDGLSLAACEGWTAWESRPMAAEAGERETTWRWAGSGDGTEVRGRVAPWPFEDDELRASVPARRLAGGPWESEAALAEDWERAEEVRLEAVLLPG
ncbi:MAG TPA: DUF3891 family protein [Gemmatimonadota bacterium]|nr:DUF3891 family protein [Gemmatimonadota bacterium]